MKIGCLVKIKNPRDEDAANLFGMVIGTKKINKDLDIQILWYTTKQDSIYTNICGVASNDSSELLEIVSEGITYENKSA